MMWPQVVQDYALGRSYEIPLVCHEAIAYKQIVQFYFHAVSCCKHGPLEIELA